MLFSKKKKYFKYATYILIAPLYCNFPFFFHPTCWPLEACLRSTIRPGRSNCCGGLVSSVVYCYFQRPTDFSYRMVIFLPWSACLSHRGSFNSLSRLTVSGRGGCREQWVLESLSLLVQSSAGYGTVSIGTALLSLVLRFRYSTYRIPV